MMTKQPCSLYTSAMKQSFKLTMSIVAPNTSELRNELTVALGTKSDAYWDTLSQYLCGQLSRAEFDELIRESVDSPHLGTPFLLKFIQLHSLTTHPLSTTTQCIDYISSRVVVASRTPDTAAGCSGRRKEQACAEAPPYAAVPRRRQC